MPSTFGVRASELKVLKVRVCNEAAAPRLSGRFLETYSFLTEPMPISKTHISNKRLTLVGKSRATAVAVQCTTIACGTEAAALKELHAVKLVRFRSDRTVLNWIVRAYQKRRSVWPKGHRVRCASGARASPLSTKR